MARKIASRSAASARSSFWPYAFTTPGPRAAARKAGARPEMIKAARLLGTDNLLVVPLRLCSLIPDGRRSHDVAPHPSH